MTNEELDEARAKEAWRLWQGGQEAGSSSWVIAARLARENWTPPEPVVDPDVLAFRKWFAGYDPNIKKLALTGKWDESQFSRAYLAGARMAREQERERAQVLVEYVDALVNGFFLYADYRERARAALAIYRGEA